MGTEGIVFINDLSDLKSLCCICLARNEQMMNLYDSLEDQQEPDVSRIYDLLCKVMMTKVSHVNYPSYICSCCLNALNISYNLKLVFEKSQNQLQEIFESYGFENRRERTEKSYKFQGVQVNQEDHEIVQKEKVESTLSKLFADETLTELCCRIEMYMKYIKNSEGYFKNVGSIEIETEENIENSALGNSVSENTKLNKIEDDLNTLKPVEENFEEDFTCELTKSTETKQYENHPDTVKVITEKMEEENVNFSESNLISKQIQTEKRQHQRKSKPTENELEETLHQLEKRCCHLCKKVFSQPERLKNHIRECHNESKNPLLCPTCGHTSKSKAGMYTHVLAKHKDSVYECDVCNKTFQNPYNLKQHQLSHANARNHLCNVCGKSFNYLQALTYHMRLHTGEKKYKCPHCDRRFTMSCTLKGHIRSHTGARPYKCSHCEKTYRWQTACKMHEMTHTSYRPYHCKHCGKGYINSYNLKVHILGHRGPHACDICDKSFLEMEYVKMHLKMFHKDAYVEEENCVVEDA